MEEGLMEIVQALNRNWIYDSYFSLYRDIRPGEVTGGNCPDTILHIFFGRDWAWSASE